MAVTAREQQIIELHEMGRSPKAIARELSLSQTYVQGRINDLCRGLGLDTVHRQRMAVGSAELARRIRRFVR